MIVSTWEAIAHTCVLSSCLGKASFLQPGGRAAPKSCSGCRELGSKASHRCGNPSPIPGACWTRAWATPLHHLYLNSINYRANACFPLHAFKQVGRQRYSPNSTEDSLPLIPASVSEPSVHVSARTSCPMQHTPVRRAEAHHLTELINGKPGCLVFSSLFFFFFFKKCFPNIVACHKVFPPLPVASPVLGWQSRIRWQAVQQTAASVSCHPSTGPY